MYRTGRRAVSFCLTRVLPPSAARVVSPPSDYCDAHSLSTPSDCHGAHGISPPSDYCGADRVSPPSSHLARARPRRWTRLLVGVGERERDVMLVPALARLPRLALPQPHFVLRAARRVAPQVNGSHHTRGEANSSHGVRGFLTRGERHHAEGEWEASRGARRRPVAIRSTPRSHHTWHHRWHHRWDHTVGAINGDIIGTSMRSTMNQLSVSSDACARRARARRRDARVPRPPRHAPPNARETRARRARPIARRLAPAFRTSP